MVNYLKVTDCNLFVKLVKIYSFINAVFIHLVSYRKLIELTEGLQPKVGVGSLPML